MHPVNVADVADGLIAEADAVRGHAEHCAEQGDKNAAMVYLQVEYGLRLVAHVFGALDPAFYVDEDDDE